MDRSPDHLVSLADTAEFEVAEGLPDVRGWEVVAADGARLGRVRELLVDPAQGRVRYLELDLPAVGSDPARRVHVPIGLARVERDRDVVIVPTVTTTAVTTVTAVSAGAITREYEIRVRRDIAGADAASLDDAADDAAFYDHADYDERRFAAPRRAEARVADEVDVEEEVDEDFSYLAGVGGAMTDRDTHPDLVGEVDAGQISVPVMQEETDARITPEDDDEPSSGRPEVEERRRR